MEYLTSWPSFTTCHAMSLISPSSETNRMRLRCMGSPLRRYSARFHRQGKGGRMASSVEQEARRLDAYARLGAVTAPRAPFTRIPLRYYAGSLVLLLIGVGCAAGYVLRSDRPVVLLVLAALCLAPAAAFLVPWALYSGSLTVYERGAVVRLRGRESVFGFADVERLGIDEREQLNNGIRVGLLRRVSLRSASERARFDSLSVDGR